jgi:nucleotide-binding universal stress UspA family protein
MKNVLLLIHDDSGQEARLQAALDLTRMFNGHLTCLDVVYVPPLIGSGTYIDSYATADLMVYETTLEGANKERLIERLRTEDVSWSWIDAAGDIAANLERAGLADVIVVNTQVTELLLPNLEHAAAKLIAGSRKPILAVPAHCPRLDLSGAMVAWDGSTCAGNALRAAVPLLQHADRVTIVEIADGTVPTPAEDAATYLSRHSVHPRIERIADESGKTGDALLAQAGKGSFSFAVMGGFGHSRAREALFGGATRMMLEHSPIPLFIAH